MQSSTKGRRNPDVISKVKTLFVIYMDFFMTDYLLFLQKTGLNLLSFVNTFCLFVRSMCIVGSKSYLLDAEGNLTEQPPWKPPVLLKAAASSNLQQNCMFILSVFWVQSKQDPEERIKPYPQKSKIVIPILYQQCSFFCQNMMIILKYYY